MEIFFCMSEERWNEASTAFIYKAGEMKDQLLTGLVVAQKWTTSDGNQSFEFAVLGQHFLLSRVFSWRK